MESTVRLNLAGRTALVTGGARGLGAAICRRLAAAGAALWVLDVRREQAEKLCRELVDDGARAHPVHADIRDAGEVARIVREVHEEAGAVDVLVNNAGVDVSKPIEHLTAEEAGFVITTNLLGPVHLCLEVYRRMVRAGGGHIVNILSTAANRTWTEAGPYAASKTGLRAFTHTLFQEAQRDCVGVGVTGVIAGGMETPFVTERFPDADTSKLQDPAIVAETVLFALSVPATSVVPELVVVPRTETSWP
ncbi:SDR family oxidoreductase [Allostreptomyces psammosilenae]|uniref:NAD(P)-dependent dehydrogenase (Short-subunit alcohol dehydrogenase family) n=1 Tax=Allostreptomyces psammosilenae TaxID=1892865 RepID=A0A853A5C5_9ACTN|nr:SDR family oxidoreductase [Allostreptomyces psammosilenae]NYI08064.1 NAD(P)-dependent dehydrogenase (short-subunit alcohol dehydrogenase family) [Allostreptomyces psammosilenae]